jgi:choline dehydrogenase-like flavoprotein
LIEVWLTVCSAFSAFGLGYLIAQLDSIIPILFGRRWKADDIWWRQLIESTGIVMLIVGFLLILNVFDSTTDYLPREIEWFFIIVLIIVSCFAGLFYADIQLRNAAQVVTSIINAMFPASRLIPLGAKEVNASEKILGFLESIDSPYKSIVLLLACAINSPLTSWYFLSTFTRFNNLSEKNQQLFVKKWINDDLLVVRSLAQAFKAMGSLGYYTDPRIAQYIGFPGPYVPKFGHAENHRHNNILHHRKDEKEDNIDYPTPSIIHKNPAKIHGITILENRKFSYDLVNSDIEVEADVCIVGSGAAGPILARELSLCDEINKVILLEKGSYHEGEDFNQRELDMISSLWKGGALTFTQNYSVFVGQAETLGGGTVINHAICIDTPPTVLDEWKAMGVSSWITDKTQFQEVLDEIKKEINVHPVKESEINRNNKILKEGAELLQIPPSGHGPNPRNCINCRECGFSHLGCHYDAKQSTLVTYIPWALQTDKCEIYCDCNVDEILVEKNVAKGIKASFQTKEGKTEFNLTVLSKIVIISAGAINSSAILLRSRLPDPNKVVGKGLSIHPSPLVLAEFPDIIQAYKGIPMSYNISEYSVLNGVAGVNPEERGFNSIEGQKRIVGGFMLESVFPNPGQLGAFLPYIGEEHQNLMKRIDNFAAAGILIRDTPKGKISLNMSKDPIVKYELDEYDKMNLSRGIQKLAEIYFKKGAERIILTRRVDPIITKEEYEQDPSILQKKISSKNIGPDQLIVGAVHPQGGNRMGEDPKTSVVNSNCQHHHVKNLFVCDASVFPTAIGVNPMLTIMAIAKRTSQFIFEKWSDMEPRK